MMSDPGDRFPNLTVQAANAAEVTFPNSLAGKFGIVLFFRGAWCAYCTARLCAFERAREDRDKLAAAIVVSSVDEPGRSPSVRLPAPARSQRFGPTIMVACMVRAVRRWLVMPRPAVRNDAELARLNHEAPLARGFVRWRDPDSNWGHHDFQSCALPSGLTGDARYRDKDLRTGHA